MKKTLLGSHSFSASRWICARYRELKVNFLVGANFISTELSRGCVCGCVKSFFFMAKQIDTENKKINQWSRTELNYFIIIHYISLYYLQSHRFSIRFNYQTRRVFLPNWLYNYRKSTMMSLSTFGYGLRLRNVFWFSPDWTRPVKLSQEKER